MPALTIFPPVTVLPQVITAVSKFLHWGAVGHLSVRNDDDELGYGPAG